jgi:hypothetical protein
MEGSVRESDFVLIICTPHYKRKSEERLGGVGYEGSVITAEIYNKQNHRKFIPILRSAEWDVSAASWMAGKVFIDLRGDPYPENSYKELVDTLLGRKPSAPSVRNSKTSPEISHGWGAGAARNSPWFRHHKRSQTSTSKVWVGVVSWRRYFGRPETFPRKNAADLNQAATLTSSSYRSPYGWSIGLVLATPEFRPLPTEGGIFAEIERRPLYTYWALSEAAEFYTLEELPEDDKSEGRIFLNTRVIRIAEALDHCARLYSNLGLPDDVELLFGIGHTGIRGRILSYAGLWIDDYINIRPSAVDECFHEIHTVRRDIRSDKLPTLVKLLAEPLFATFDFFRLEDDKYRFIVENFVNGRCV